MEPHEASGSSNTNDHGVTQVDRNRNGHGVIIEDVESDDSDYEDANMRTNIDNLAANKKFFVTSDRVEELPSPNTETEGPRFPLRKLFPPMEVTKVNKITEMEPYTETEPPEFKGILINSILKRGRVGHTSDDCPACFICHALDHQKNYCPAQCSNCGNTGHRLDFCLMIPKCTLCQGTGHWMATCHNVPSNHN
jgi:hypothetical protein